MLTTYHTVNRDSKKNGKRTDHNKKFTKIYENPKHKIDISFNVENVT